MSWLARSSKYDLLITSAILSRDKQQATLPEIIQHIRNADSTPMLGVIRERLDRSGLFQKSDSTLGSKLVYWTITEEWKQQLDDEDVNLSRFRWRPETLKGKLKYGQDHIVQAIRAHTDEQATVSEIYDFLQLTYKMPRKETTSWMILICYNLLKYEIYVKLPKRPGQAKHKWTVREEWKVSYPAPLNVPFPADHNWAPTYPTQYANASPPPIWAGGHVRIPNTESISCDRPPDDPISEPEALPEPQAELFNPMIIKLRRAFRKIFESVPCLISNDSLITAAILSHSNAKATAYQICNFIRNYFPGSLRKITKHVKEITKHLGQNANYIKIPAKDKRKSPAWTITAERQRQFQTVDSSDEMIVAIVNSIRSEILVTTAILSHPGESATVFQMYAFIQRNLAFLCGHDGQWGNVRLSEQHKERWIHALRESLTNKNIYIRELQAEKFTFENKWTVSEEWKQQFKGATSKFFKYTS